MEAIIGDRNEGPWIIEEVSKAPCVNGLQFKFLVFLRRIGYYRKPTFTTESGRLSTKTGETFYWSKCITQGDRPYQEDRDVVAETVKFYKESPENEGEVKEDDNEELALFAVFDGHGIPNHGHKISEFCKSVFKDFVQREIDHYFSIKYMDRSTTPESFTKSFNRVDIPDSQSTLPLRKGTQANALELIFEKVCFNLDLTVRQRFPTIGRQAGTTLSAILLSSSRAVFVNLGDSRGAQCLFKKDVEKSAGYVAYATHDHKPTREDEFTRITHAGGWIESQRVNGDLAVSRSIGDFDYKPNGSPTKYCPVSVQPSVDSITRDYNDKYEEMYILATDGLWDTINTAEACQFIYDEIRKTRLNHSKDSKRTFCLLDALSKAVTKLVAFVFKKRLASDNLTVIVILPVREQQSIPKEVHETMPLSPT